MNLMITMLMIINSFIFIQMSHPMTMGLILLMQTLLTCLMMGMMTQTFWFSYILFLIFIGGMLILFIYMASLTSNEVFNFSVLNLMKINSIILIVCMMYLFIDHYLMSSLFFNNEINPLLEMINLMKENYLSTSKMYDLPNNFIIVFLINYLLLNLVIIVKITNLFQGPLRMKN